MRETIKNYLQSRGMTATIYIDFLPASPDTALLIRQTPGRMPDSTGYSLPSFQVISRAASYTTARDNIELAQSYLHAQNYSSTISGAVYIIDIWKLQDPYFMGRDDQNRFTFVQNYQVQIKDV